jgi:hypothetical protein
VSDTQRGAGPPGWNTTFPEHLPQPTPAPALFAFGVTLLGWGLISTPLLVLVGGSLLFTALLHWVAEIWHDTK